MKIITTCVLTVLGIYLILTETSPGRYCYSPHFTGTERYNPDSQNAPNF